MITKLASPRWELHPRHAPEQAYELASRLGAPPPVGHVLWNRGIADPDAARAFLEPSVGRLHDPFDLMGMTEAVARVRGAIERRERILVYGDYDVDGVTSTFLILAALRDLGATVAHRIPHRTLDGYGLSTAMVDEAARAGCRLILTVDCGVTALREVEEARRLGLDVVITDHHEPGPLLPRAAAVVNPHQPGCDYPCKSLAGVGVTFKLVQALRGGREGSAEGLEFLEFVALGTIADAVPLIGENRVMVSLGLDALSRTRNLGLQALVEIAGLSHRSIGAGQVAFHLAPRLNAAGRVGNAQDALRLLLAGDREEARACARSLEEDNERRRALGEMAEREATALVHAERHWPARRAIVLWSDAWHPGVVGIVASRLAERFVRPTLLVALRGGIGRGSGRSVRGFDLTHALGRCQDLLVAHGGHAYAAGFTVERDRLPALRERVEELARAEIAPEDCEPRITIDDDLRLEDCTLHLVEWLERLAPHGPENAEPLFRARGVEVQSVSTVGEGRHLKMRVRDASGGGEGIGFGLGEAAASLHRGARVTLAYVPQRNEWMGETTVQLKVKEISSP